MSRIFVQSSLSISIAFIVMTGSAAHATNGYFSSGYGIKNDAVAGVGAALPQDALTIAVNPAGLTEVGHQLNIGLDIFAPERSASIQGNAFGPNTEFNAIAQSSSISLMWAIATLSIPMSHSESLFMVMGG